MFLCPYFDAMLPPHSTYSFRRALTASVNNCREIRAVPLQWRNQLLRSLEEMPKNEAWDISPVTASVESRLLMTARAIIRATDSSRQSTTTSSRRRSTVLRRDQQLLLPYLGKGESRAALYTWLHVHVIAISQPIRLYFIATCQLKT